MAKKLIAQKRWQVLTRNAQTWEWNQPAHSSHMDYDAAVAAKKMVDDVHASWGLGSEWTCIAEVMAVTAQYITYKPIQDTVQS
jgi:hypothetical protein